MIYLSLFFSLSGHVYSQFPEIEISKLPTSRLGHPKEKQDGKVSLFNMSSMKASLSKLLLNNSELSRFDYFGISTFWPYDVYE